MVGVLVVNEAGLALAMKLAREDELYAIHAPRVLGAGPWQTYERLGDRVNELFGQTQGLIFIMASGIAVRLLAPLLRDKMTDPGVVVVDEAGDFAISLVGGHEGGANNLAYRVAEAIGAEPVLTTGSEVAKDVIVGIGCRRAAGVDAIKSAVMEALSRAGHELGEVKTLATIEFKRNDGDLRKAAESLGLPLRFINKDTLNNIGAQTSATAAAIRAFGVEAVCEPAALAAGRGFWLVLPKQVLSGVTVAVARRGGAGAHAAAIYQRDKQKTSRGRLSVIGIGQGGDTLTIEAQRALGRATDIVGYRTYVRSIAEHIGERQIHEFGMGREMERVRRAVELAADGRQVALVSSGDAGIYGMAGPLMEVVDESDPDFEIEVIPGVTAASAAAAAVGAPLMNDYVTISLSDIMTPWAEIARRVEAAAGADLVVAIYNPKSSKRKTQLETTRQILLGHRPDTTPVAVVRNAGQAAHALITDLKCLPEAEIDMRCTVIVGNSHTKVISGRLVTTRGYRL